jgi:hypothetical protein
MVERADDDEDEREDEDDVAGTMASAWPGGLLVVGVLVDVVARERTVEDAKSWSEEAMGGANDAVAAAVAAAAVVVWDDGDDTGMAVGTGVRWVIIATAAAVVVDSDTAELLLLRLRVDTDMEEDAKDASTTAAAAEAVRLGMVEVVVVAVVAASAAAGSGAGSVGGCLNGKFALERETNLPCSPTRTINLAGNNWAWNHPAITLSAKGP